MGVAKLCGSCMHWRKCILVRKVIMSLQDILPLRFVGVAQLCGSCMHWRRCTMVMKVIMSPQDIQPMTRFGLLSDP